jgi:hypothetical protein
VRRTLLALVTALLLGCSSNPIVDVEPPTPVTETRPPRPYADAYWRTGHHAWDESTKLYHWVPGSWNDSREGYVWFPGEWEPVEEGGKRVGWRWVDDRWVQLVDLERTEYGE